MAYLSSWRILLKSLLVNLISSNPLESTAKIANWSEGGRWLAFKDTNNSRLCFEISRFDFKYHHLDGVASLCVWDSTKLLTLHSSDLLTLLMLIIALQPHLTTVDFVALCFLKFTLEDNFSEYPYLQQINRQSTNKPLATFVIPFLTQNPTEVACL